MPQQAQTVRDHGCISSHDNLQQGLLTQVIRLAAHSVLLQVECAGGHLHMFHTFQNSVQRLWWHKSRKNGLFKGHKRTLSFLERQYVQKALWTTCNTKATCPVLQKLKESSQMVWTYCLVCK